MGEQSFSLVFSDKLSENSDDCPGQPKLFFNYFLKKVDKSLFIIYNIDTVKERRKEMEMMEFVFDRVVDLFTAIGFIGIILLVKEAVQ